VLNPRMYTVGMDGARCSLGVSQGSAALRSPITSQGTTGRRSVAVTGSLPRRVGRCITTRTHSAILRNGLNQAHGKRRVSFTSGRNGKPLTLNTAIAAPHDRNYLPTTGGSGVRCLRWFSAAASDDNNLLPDITANVTQVHPAKGMNFGDAGETRGETPHPHKTPEDYVSPDKGTDANRTLDNGSAPFGMDAPDGVNVRYFLNDHQLFERAISADNLKRAWEQIKSNPGMMTRAMTSQTLDGIQGSWFEKANQLLLKGSYVYPERRRVHIPKPGRSETRPITIVDAKVKIIEKAILNAIEPHFEGLYVWKDASEETWSLAPASDRNSGSPKYRVRHWLIPRVFSGLSHGFRPGRSAHTALSAIKEWRLNTSWLLDYDVRKAFDNVNRHRLRNIFKKTIQDDRVWQEIAKMMNGGIVDVTTVQSVSLQSSELGVPQGGVLSPFLFNVYMTELDKKMEALIADLSITTPIYERNPEARRQYSALQSRFAPAKLRTRLAEYKSIPAILEARRAALQEHYRKFGSVTGEDRTSRHMHYVRYADDFLVGVVGPRDFALRVRSEIDNFVKGDLHLEIKKNDLVPRQQGNVAFLGFTISLSQVKFKVRVEPRRIEALKRYRRRVIRRLVQLNKKMARSQVYSMQALTMRAFRLALERRQSSWKDPNARAAAASEIACLLTQSPKVIREFETSRAGPASNDALRRWERALSHKFAKPLALGVSEALRSLEGQVIEASILDQVEQLHQDLISGLDRIRQSLLQLEMETEDERARKAWAKFKSGSNSSCVEVTQEQLSQYCRGLKIAFPTRERRARISILAPIHKQVAKLQEKGYFHAKKPRPQGNGRLLLLHDAEIVAHYARIMHGLLEWFRPADNFGQVQSLVEALRRSCQHTLARKHNKSAQWVMYTYGADVAVQREPKPPVALPSRVYVRSLSKKFLPDLSTQRWELGRLLALRTSSLQRAERFWHRCAVIGCEATNIQVHHIRRLWRREEKDGRLSVLDSRGRRVTGLAAIMTARQRKQLPLCAKHHAEMERGIFSPLDQEYLSKTFGGLKSGNLEQLYKTGESAVDGGSPPPC